MEGHKKAIGIIGGMGPAATADLFAKIIANTQAETDQQHLRVLIDSNTNIPDRTASILTGSDAPLTELVKSAVGLEHQGAGLLVIACNTAHYYYDKLVPNVGIPVLSMVEETALHLKNKGITRAGLLATDGVLHTGLYTNALTRHGIEAVVPEEGMQQHVMDLIYNCVKADAYESFDIGFFLNLLVWMTRQGVQTLILGCTELPLAFAHYGVIQPAVDPTLLLARAAIRAAGGTVKPERAEYTEGES